MNDKQKNAAFTSGGCPSMCRKRHIRGSEPSYIRRMARVDTAQKRAQAHPPKLKMAAKSRHSCKITIKLL